MADEEIQDSKREIPIEWHLPEGFVSRYANNMVVQHTETEIIISFFETKPPMLLTAEDLAALEQLGSIRSECVARIIVSPLKMPKFIEAMQTNYQRYLSKQQEGEE